MLARSIAVSTLLASSARGFVGFSLARSFGTSLAMAEVKVGDTLPAVDLRELKEPGGSPETVKLTELCAGKKVALFGVPGAFTPGCSKSHLPSFIEAQNDLKSKGVDLTVCVATNDAWVMEAWGRTSGGTAAGIRFLADDSGELTKALGLSKESPSMLRMARFSLIADDNKVTHYFSSAKQASDTWAPAVLSAL
jgi:peroxiredoxin